MIDTLITLFADYWPLIIPLLFTAAAYHDLKLAESTSKWHLTSAQIKTINSKGQLIYEYNGGGMKFTSEYLNFREYLGNCNKQPLDAPNNFIIGKPKRCSAGKPWLPSIFYQLNNRIPHWETGTKDSKDIILKAGKERGSKILLQYSEDDWVNAYFDPAHPETAVITPYHKENTWYKDEFVRIYYLGIGLTIWLLMNLVATQYGLTEWLYNSIKAIAVLTVLGWIIRLFSIGRRNRAKLQVSPQTTKPDSDEISWKQCEATIYSSFVRERKLEGTKNLGPERAKIVYKYIVSGKKYSGEYISNRIDGSPYEIVKKYPEMSQIDILYDSRNPARSKIILD